MKKGYFLILCLFTLLGCTTEGNGEKGTDITKTYLYQDVTKPFDERLKDYYKNAIGIEEGEIFTTKIYEEHLNDDDKKEIIITVNRKDYAFEQAKKNNIVAKASSIDYFGNYNVIVIFNSKTQQFYAPIIFGSSAYKPLELYFENIGPYSHKDMIIDYTIGDAKFRKYFLFNSPEGKIDYAFHWIIFQDWKIENIDAACFSLETSSKSTFKDIVIRKGKLTPLKEGQDYNSTDAKIECSSVIEKRFFFNPKDGKYYTEDL